MLKRIIFTFAIIGSYIGFVGKLYDYQYSKNIISAADIIAGHYISMNVNAYGLVQCTYSYVSCEWLWSKNTIVYLHCSVCMYICGLGIGSVSLDPAESTTECDM